MPRVQKNIEIPCISTIMSVSQLLQPIEVSILIPTCNRPHSIGKLLDFFESRLNPSYEIIVIAQGICPPTCVRPFVKLIHLENPSLTKARNAGIEASVGAIILFLDDDVIPMEDIANMHYGLHKEFAQHTVIAGAVFDEHNKGDKDATVTYDTTRMIYRSDYARIDSSDVVGMPGCHMSFKRKVFDSLRFDTWFRGNAHFEEIDVAMRLRKKGGRIRFDSRAHLIHVRENTGGCRMQTDTKKFLFDHFFNVAFCFSKNVGIIYIVDFLRQQRHEIEFSSRIKKGHDLGLVFACVRGCSIGLIAGFIRKITGSAWFT